MENYSKWDKEEIKTLFKFVEIKKQEGMPLIKIFLEYAEKTFRQANSVRNYYYKELGEMIKNKQIAKNFGINLQYHSITQSKPFSKEEEGLIVKQIDELKSKGYSVRKACLELSNGDVSQMIRLQNKYRAVTNSKKQYNTNVNMGQVIQMPQKQPKISDEEIKALFLGLIRIVKKQEQDNAKTEYENELFKANEKLKKVMNEIAEKQLTINCLQDKLMLIKKELQGSSIQSQTSLSNTKNNTASAILKKYFSEQKIFESQDGVVKK